MPPPRETDKTTKPRGKSESQTQTWADNQESSSNWRKQTQRQEALNSTKREKTAKTCVKSFKNSFY